MKKRRIFAIIGITVLTLLIGFGIFYLTFLEPLFAKYREVRSMPIMDVDLSMVKDGVYLGEYNFSNTEYKVEIIVKDHLIKDIKVLENASSEYAKKAEKILDKVIETQSLQVDIIAGSTTTSKSLLKALENGLQKGIQE